MTETNVFQFSEPGSFADPLTETGPDRLVIDFPNAVPGSQVRSQSIDRGEVKDRTCGRAGGRSSEEWPGGVG